MITTGLIQLNKCVQNGILIQNIDNIDNINSCKTKNINLKRTCFYMQGFIFNECHVILFGGYYRGKYRYSLTWMAHTIFYAKV